MELIKSFLWLSFYQSVIVALALFFIKGKIIANRFLALHTLCWGMMCFYRLTPFLPKEFFAQYHYTLKFNFVLEVMMFVFVYLYVKYLSADTRKFNYSDLLHFIPALGAFIFWLTFIVKPVDEKLLIFHTHGYFRVMELLLFSISVVQGVVYFILSAKYVKKYHRALQENYSNTSAKKLYWMQMLIGIVPVMIIMGTVGGMLGHSLSSRYIFNVMYIVIGFSIYLTSFFMLTRHSLFVLPDELSLAPLSAHAVENSVSSLQDQAYLMQLKIDLEKVMTDEKLYLYPDITINTVSQRLNASRQQVSDVLHSMLDTNFFDYINRYRVEEAKRKIKDDSSNLYSLNALGIDAGFNSKASFYRNFKKWENMTPAEYKQLITTVNN